MPLRKKLLIIVSSIVGLLILQFVTFYTIGPHQLKKYLLTGELEYRANDHPNDTVFVTDFYLVDCGSSNIIFLSHHLHEDTATWRVKLNAKHIVFQDHDDRDFDPPLAGRVKLVYETWMEYPEPSYLGSLFKAKQVEFVLFDQNESLYRQVTYRWWLFMWVPQLEVVDIIRDVEAYRARSEAEYLQRHPQDSVFFRH